MLKRRHFYVICRWEQFYQDDFATAGTTAPEKTFTAALATTAGIQGAATSTAAFMTSREKDSGASYIYSKNAKSSTESGTATSGKQDKTTSIFAIMGGLGGFVILVLFAMVIRLSMAKRSKKHSDETGKYIYQSAKYVLACMNDMQFHEIWKLKRTMLKANSAFLAQF